MRRQAVAREAGAHDTRSGRQPPHLRPIASHSPSSVTSHLRILAQRRPQWLGRPAASASGTARSASNGGSSSTISCYPLATPRRVTAISAGRTVECRANPAKVFQQPEICTRCSWWGSIRSRCPPARLQGHRAPPGGAASSDSAAAHQRGRRVRSCPSGHRHDLPAVGLRRRRCPRRRRRRLPDRRGRGHLLGRLPQ